MRPADMPFSMQLLKIQEPCPPCQMVSLTSTPISPNQHGKEDGGGGSCIFNSCIEKGMENLVKSPLCHNI